MMGHLNNSAYATYFELARLQFLMSLFEQNSFKWTDVVANLNIDYRIPVVPQSKPIMYISCSRIGNSSYDLEYKVVEETDETHLYAEGKTVQVCVDPKTQTSQKLPDPSKEILSNVLVPKKE
jgi:acyl-CoA thioester hydrolase